MAAGAVEFLALDYAGGERDDLGCFCGFYYGAGTVEVGCSLVSEVFTLSLESVVQ